MRPSSIQEIWGLNGVSSYGERHGLARGQKVQLRCIDIGCSLDVSKVDISNCYSSSQFCRSIAAQ